MSPRGRRRAVSPPTRPEGQASAQPLVMSFPVPEMPVPGVRAGNDDDASGSQSLPGGPAVTQQPGIERILATEDRPEAWGDRPDDLGDFLQSERPPHW